MTSPEPAVLPAPPGRMPAFLHARVGGFPRSFWALWTGTLVNRTGAMVQPFLALFLSTTRGLSIAQAGLVVTVLGIGSLGAQVIGGALADRIGRRTTMTLATFATGGAMLALGYARGLPMIMAAALLLGLTMDMYRPASAAAVADIIDPADRPRAFAMLFWAINLGWAVAMVFGGMLADQGFLWLFWINAATCVLFGALVWRAVPESRPEPGADEGAPRGGFGEVLRDRVMVAYTLLFLAYVFTLMQGMTTMPLAMRELGLGPRDYGLAIAMNGVLIVLAQPLVGPWLARFDRGPVLALGFALTGVGYAATALATTVWGFVGTILLWTVGEIIASVSGQAIVADLARPHLRGRYSALWGMAWSGGFLLAPLGGTQLLGFGREVLWLTCGGIGVAAAAGVLALSPALRRRAAPPFSSK
ncbi:MFS transporter [Actinomadura kijaniata]|uniref:MFS family permease n=1 Tax=Actinomadura namibiensis TaxID=182080 RepID=A0A7W3LWW3_ACTNM|nr:MFS transporter [Actinomadura namibiensis]MBA8955805.1 MFS family permease [Actinomadura namibiensis]